ncbi:putative mannosyltransferase [Stachybotrys elegans]|uniref:GPI mannosyltransferase 1 n=1 Tax=Stachybotrys elegans TaxID=80388 RepID=A0A8K0WNZ1_9HYPO|nr:putative mannosyltransferase [Stachybotrys elegans]
MAASILKPLPLYSIAILLRIGLLLYGSWQDANSALKFTDIDHVVFSQAAEYVAQGASPYQRETYRYTPLLAWLLVPTSSFSLFAKILFCAADVLAGALILDLLRRRGIAADRAGGFAALWLWNPMIAVISTRGSSEGILAVLTMALLWAVETSSINLAGVVLGLGVHFKIYPFIYAPAVIWYMDAQRLGLPSSKPSSLIEAAIQFISPARIRLTVISLATFMGLNLLMYSIYGMPFLEHTFLYHVTRIDHRHNFSPFNILLYLESALPSSSFRAESLAFAPQLLLSCILIPLVLAKKDLATSMMAQTFAFVTFNKVCTSQYFLWYMIFLPLYLPNSSMLTNTKLGVSALGLWILGQAAWLQQGYNLEFLGLSTFFPEMWLASLAFFLINCWILGIIIGDGAEPREGRP